MKVVAVKVGQVPVTKITKKPVKYLFSCIYLVKNEDFKEFIAFWTLCDEKDLTNTQH